MHRGNIVIYPVAELPARASADDAMRDAIAGLRRAIQSLKGEGLFRPNLKQIAFVRHSLGGGLPVQLASLAERKDSPRAEAGMAVEAGWQAQGIAEYPRQNLSHFPAWACLLVIEGKEDRFEDGRKGKATFIANGTSCCVLTALCNRPPIANHYAPVRRREPST